MANKRFPVFDGDSHVVEPPELWTKYLEPEYRTLGKHALWREEGKLGSYLKVNGKSLPGYDELKYPAPRDLAARDDLGQSRRARSDSASSDDRGRLKSCRLACAIWMRWVSTRPFSIRPGLPRVSIWSKIRTWRMRSPARTTTGSRTSARPRQTDCFGAAMVPLQNMDYAVEELRRVAKIPCFRGAFIRPMFIEGHYFTHPYYDPLWAELESLGITAAVHSTTGLWNPEWTSHGPFFEKVKRRLNQRSIVADAGGGPHAGGGGDQGFTFVASPPLGHPIAPILSYWLDNHMFVASTLIGFTVMQRYPKMKVVVAHGKASWMEEVLEKMEASTRTIPLLHYYPVRTDTEELWKEGQVMLGFDAEERLIQKLPDDFAEKVVWGSRYPHHDTTSAIEAIETLDAGSGRRIHSRAHVGWQRRRTVRS